MNRVSKSKLEKLLSGCLGLTLLCACSAEIRAVKTSLLFPDTHSALQSPLTIASIITPSNANYGASTHLNFGVLYSAAVTVSGAPRLLLDVGGTQRYATYASGSGTTLLMFTYTTSAPDLDSDGVSLSSPVDLNSGTITGAASQGASLNFSPPLMSGVLIDAVAPAVALTSLNGGQIFGGGTTNAITWTASDPNLAASPISLAYSTNNGITYTAIPGATGISNSGNFSWTLPSIDSTQVFVRVSAVDTYGNNGSVVSAAPFSIATTPPIFTAGQMILNGGVSPTAKPYSLLSLKATDIAAKITHFCIKRNNTTAPLASDPCWNAVNANPPALTPALNLNLTNFSTLISYVPGTYALYAWARDELNHISNLSSAGAGTLAKDKVSINYDPKTPPAISLVWVTNAVKGPISPTQADQSIPVGNSVYIQWNATAANGFGVNPISLDYTTDDLNFTPIPGAFLNASNSGCSVEASHTGCYTWVGGSPTNNYYRIRVTAKDSNGFITAILSTLINSPKLRLLAGNTYEGVNASAASAVLLPRDDNPFGFSDHTNLVVVPDGRMFLRDKKGLLMVDPADGLLKLIIPTTGARTGMGGPAASASLLEPSQIAYGYNHGILILDQNAVLKLDLTTFNVSVLIGGGTQTVDGVTPANVQFTNVGSSPNDNEWLSRDPLIALPNGNVYFKTERQSVDTPSSGLRYRVYNYATSGQVTSIPISGTGYSENGGANLSTCTIRGMALAYDPVTSAVSKMVLRVLSTSGACSGASGFVSVDPVTGIAAGPHPSKAPLNPSNLGISLHTSLRGEIFGMDAFRLYKLDSSGSSWTILAGDPSLIQGECASGTAALSCKMTPQGIFVGAQNDLYFWDRNRIRTVDSTNTVRDIYGQPLSFGDGGPVLSARFNSIESFGVASGKIIVHDEFEYRIREMDAGQVTFTSIAGDGSVGSTPSSGTALNSPLATNNNSGHNIAVDAATGDVYYSMERNGIERLDRSTGMWSAITTFSASYYLPQTFANGKLLMGYATYPNVDNMFELYDKAASYAQTHLIGKLGTAFNHWSADTGVINATTQTRVSQNAAGTWDSVNSRWMLWDEEAFAVRTITGTALGTWGPGSIGGAIYNFDYKPSTDTLFYCSQADNRIYKITGVAAPVALQWDVPSILCSGTRLYYNSGSDSLYLIYQQGNMHGFAEYLSP